MAKLVPADLPMKQSGERIVALIVYDYQMARAKAGAAC